jgi:hypothetical protein
VNESAVTYLRYMGDSVNRSQMDIKRKCTNIFPALSLEKCFCLTKMISSPKITVQMLHPTKSTDSCMLSSVVHTIFKDK